MIRKVTEFNLQNSKTFLEAHIETSLFLLSNLAELGPRLGENLNSGNYRCIEEDGDIVAVFCLTRRGNLLVQTDERNDLVNEILRACEDDLIRIEGVVAEWQIAQALWVSLCANPEFQPTYTSKGVLYRLILADDPTPSATDETVRYLVASDFEQWKPLYTAFLLEEGLPVQGTSEQLRVNFTRQTDAGHWWGAFEGSQLIALVGLNASYGGVGQIGGVYTLPEKRRKGLARSAMGKLLTDVRDRHHLEKLILFTGESNVAARGLYESLHFKPIGYFGLLFGSWTEADVENRST